MVDASVLEGNRLLSLLPAGNSATIRRLAEHVPLTFKEPVMSAGKPIDYVYFPLSGIVSIIVDLDEGFSVEAVTVGREGMVGLNAFLNTPRPPWRAFCQIAGDALRVRARDFLQETRQDDHLALVLFRYTNAVIAGVAQTAACNRAHTLEERMCRWLLTTRDRVDSDDFPLTQEFLGQMLGVRRPSVSLAGIALQHAGLISYTRGRITIRDRTGVEQASCECYEAAKRHYEESMRM
ncbi:MAG TPA: Crp/Fnr family transcriptional regulator [Candidatus Polarisedimenticolaceae bacterium]|nr:Crp/Fnr family transcriptional regulator [Candidatus Polarisedimenticolaceae bacterium]